MKEHLGPKLDAYLDGTLGEADRAAVRDHLQSCPACRQELAKLNELAGQLEQSQPPASEPGTFKHYWNRLLFRHKEVRTMSTIQRLKRVVESNLHSAIDAMEDPAKMIRQLLREMEAAVHQSREELVEAIVVQKGLAHRFQEATARIQKWDDRAALAMRNGREDLAREALQEQLQLESLSDEFKEEADRQLARVSELKASLKRLERQVAALRGRKALWLSQAQSALRRSTSRQAYETAYGELARMLDITREQSARETAISEVFDGEIVEDTLDAMGRDEALEQKLVALKRRLAS